MRLRKCVTACLAGGFLLAASGANGQEADQQVSPEAMSPSEATTLPEVVVDTGAEQTAAPAKPKPKAKTTSTGQGSGAPATAETDGERGGPETATGPVKDYVATRSVSGTKTDTPLRETPQSISVVGTEQMRDQGVQNLQESIRYVPGVLADGWGYDSRVDFSLIRGTKAAYFVDGLRTSYGYFVNTAPIEPYALERVEVLRGPSSMLYGQTPTGGIINGISKLPSEYEYNEITVEYGSFDFKQVKFDSTGKLSEDGKWLYRMTGLARDAETQVDFVDNNRLMLAPSLTYRPTNNTSITVMGNFRDDQSGSTQQFLPYIGTAVPNVNGRIVDRSTFIGEPGDFYDTKQQQGTLIVDHKFAEGLKLHHVSRYTHTDNAYLSTYAVVLTPFRLGYLASATIPVNPATAPFLDSGQSLVGRAVLEQYTETKVFNTDTNLTAEVATGAVKHKLTGGLDYMRYASGNRTAGTLLDNIDSRFQPYFNIYDPQYGLGNGLLSLGGGAPIPRDDIPLYESPYEVQKQTGLYIQDQLKLGNWGAVLGVRQDWLSIESGDDPDRRETATTGRAALMYNFDFGLTPYVSYSTAFTPQAGTLVGDDIYTTVTNKHVAGPVEGEQFEIGFKYQPEGLPFSFNAAYYDLTDKNRVVAPDSLVASVQGADINVRGFEIEAAGKVTQELKVIASYSYSDATYEKHPEVDPLHPGLAAYMVGKPVEYVPKHLASLWAIYSFSEPMLRGLSIGAGARYVGATESFGIDIGTGTELYVKTPSYTVFDAMVAYETDDWRWQLTAQNLEDEYYVTSCSAFRGDCGIGQARTIITGFTYKF